MDYLKEFQKLRDSRPRLAVGLISNENCDFCNYADQCRNCYLTVSTYRSEKCINGRSLFYCDYCIDCDFVEKCELCYECIDCKGCYNCNFLQDCENCVDCEYCLNCKGCQNCLGCTNLRQKKFYIFNEKHSESEYKQKLEELKKINPDDLEKYFKNIKLITPRIAEIGENNQESSGDHIFNNKNCHYCFETKESQDCAYSRELFKCEDCIDVMIGEFAKWNFDCVSTYHLHNSNFCYNCWESSDLEYCEQCHQCEHCLFCCSLKHKEYHIFNKPYKKDEYFRKKAEIIKEMKEQGTYGKWIPSTYPFEDSMASAKI